MSSMFTNIFNLWRPVLVEKPNIEGEYLTTVQSTGKRIVKILKWTGTKWVDRDTGDAELHYVVAWKRLPKTF